MPPCKREKKGEEYRKGFRKRVFRAKGQGDGLARGPLLMVCPGLKREEENNNLEGCWSSFPLKKKCLRNYNIEPVQDIFGHLRKEEVGT